MKYFKSIIFALLFLAPFISCKKKFLEVKDESNINRQSYVKDLRTMEDFMNGVYIMLSTNYESLYAAAYPELVADNLKPISSTKPLILHYTVRLYFNYTIWTGMA